MHSTEAKEARLGVGKYQAPVEKFGTVASVSYTNGKAGIQSTQD
jgi:hypothetical protein